MSTSAYGASWAILKQGIVRRNRMGGNLASWLLAGLGVMLMLGMGLRTGNWHMALALGAGIPAAVLAMLWWGFIHAAVVLQNRTSARRLVPGLRQRSLVAVFGLWAVLTLGFGALFALHFGSSLMPLGVVAFLMSIVGICTLEGGFGGIALLMFAVCPLLFSIFKPGDAVMQAVPWIVAWSAPAVTALWVWMECRMIDRATALPLASPAREQSAHRGENSLMSGAVPGATPADLASVSAGSGQAAPMLLKALRVASAPGAGEWWQGALYFLMMVFVIKQPVLVLASAVGFQIMYAHTLRTRVLSLPREQALVRPAAADFNRVLGRALLGRFGVVWAQTSMVAAVAVMVISRDWTSLLHTLLTLSLTLPAAALFLAGYGINSKMLKSVLAIIAVALLYGIAFIAATKTQAEQACMLAVILGCTWLFLAQALRRLAGAPVVFPAGRFG